MKTINVKASSCYDVIISDNLLSETGRYIKNTVGGSSVTIISDDIVYPLYGQQVESSLIESGYKVIKYIIVNGEASKNAVNYIAILNFLADHHMTRSDIIVALGGGVVGDLAGFIASTYLRGLRFIQIPTTLLAAVDSSVGGKNAINLHAGKNLAGTFFQPDLVLCDYSVMSSLNESIFTDGCAEVIKYGIIADEELFYMLNNPIKEQLEEIISQCVLIKQNIVCSDEYDNGLRQILNFGHTIGHAVEICSNYIISHGNAVSIGMAILTRASFFMNICSRTCCDRIIAMLKKHNLPTEVTFNEDELFYAALSDKKRSGDFINIVIPEEIGRCVIKKITINHLKEIIHLGIENKYEV